MPQTDGQLKLHIGGDDGYRLFVNDKHITEIGEIIHTLAVKLNCRLRVVRNTVSGLNSLIIFLRASFVLMLIALMR